MRDPLKCSYDMVLVPEGSFIMGTNRDLERDAELDEIRSEMCGCRP
jgi:hypothetical protein